MKGLFEILANSISVAEILCALVASIFFFKYKSSSLKWLLVHLWLIVIGELVGMKLYFAGLENRWIYNLLGVEEFVIFMYIFYGLTTKDKLRKVIKTLSVIGVSLIGIDALFFTKTIYDAYLNYTFALTSIFIASVSIWYLLEMVRSDKVLDLKKNLSFWLAVGLLFYYLCTLPVTILSNIIPEIWESNGNVTMMVQTISSYLLYGSFILGFIWTKKYNS